MEAEQRKHPRIDGGRGRKCRSTDGGPIGGADRRAEVQSKGQIGGSEAQSEGESAERKSEAVQQARASNRRRGRSSDGWMEAARRRIPGAAAAALFSSSLSTLFPSQSLDFACCWDGARPRRRYTRSISPALASRHPFFRARAADFAAVQRPPRRIGRQGDD